MCSTQDLIYLQGEPVRKGEISKLNDAPYKVQVHDILTINIKTNSGDEELDKLVSLFNKTANSNNGSSNQNINGYENSMAAKEGFSIDRDGNIRFPVIGEINVLGYTTKEVRIKLEEKLLEYLNKKGIFFVTVRLAGIKYTIFGEIKDRGPRLVNQNSVNIFEAISNSGGITLLGNRKNVELIRGPAGDRKKYTIDLTKVSAFNSEIFQIQPNDLIYIKPLKQKSWGTGSTGFQSLTTIVSVMSLITSTILIMRNL